MAKPTIRRTKSDTNSDPISINFSLSSYSDALFQLTREVLIGFHNLEPLLSNFPSRYSEHCGPIRSVRGDAPLDQPFDAVSFEAQLSREVVEECDVEGYAVFLKELSDRRLEAMAPGFFERINAIVSAVGNNLDTGGQAFTYATYLEVLSRGDLINFEADGTPLMPNLYGHPDMMKKVEQSTPTEDEKRQLDKLIEQKRREYFAQKRTRRLS